MSECAELMSKLATLVRKTHPSLDCYTLDRVLSGTMHPTVSRIDAALCTLPRRSEMDLKGGGKAEWRVYLEEALLKVDKRYYFKETSRFYNTPKSFQIQEIGKRFGRYTAAGSATFQIVQGVDALVLASSPLAKNGILQVASQFNFLESKTPNYTNIIDYLDDHTQGPRASLGSLAALILRDYCFENRDQNWAFFKESECYDGGYFMPWKLPEKEQQVLYLRLCAKISSLAILAQWGFPDVGDYHLLQIFTAAPSYQDKDIPSPNSYGEKICTLLVEAQYRAVAQLAAMRSVVSKARVPLHLTLVGQGAFNNPPSVMKAAFLAVLATVECFDVDVYVHGYSKEDVKKIRGFMPRDVREMSKYEFFK